jgi:hypothetical protein
MRYWSKAFILSLLFVVKFTFSFSQERPFVEWQVQKENISENETILTFSFVTEKGWSVYAINPDSLDMKISMTVNFIPNESYSLIEGLTVENAISKFDTDLDVNVSYFLEKGTLKQRVKRIKSGVIDVKINYMMIKQTSTVVGNSGMIFKGNDSLQVELK